MPILKAGHYYTNRNPKKSNFINEIIPQRDLCVPVVVFDSFEDKTDATITIKDDYFTNPKKAIEECIINAV